MIGRKVHKQIKNQINRYEINVYSIKITKSFAPLHNID